MEHLKEYNKFFSDNANTIYRVWDDENNVILEFEESGMVFLSSYYSKEGEEILEFLGINASQHEIESDKILDIIEQIRNEFPQYKVEEW